MEPQAPPASPSLAAWLPAAVSTLLALVVFGVTLRGTFLIDDVFAAQQDPRLATPAKWIGLWTTAYSPASLDRLWRPLTSTTFAVQHWLFGSRAWPFHLVNVLLHAAASAAVAELARRLGGYRTSWVAGLLFAVHPVHTEVVAGLVGRAESLCTLATCAGLCLILRRPLTSRRVAAILGCFLAALLSKEQGMLFPLFLLALVPVCRASGTRSAEERHALRWLIVGVVWLLAGYGVYREEMIGSWWNRGAMYWIYNPMIRSAGIDRILMPVVLLGRYTALLVAPIKLSPDYSGMAIGWHARPGDPYLYVGGLTALLFSAILAVAVIRRCWPAVFCLIAMAVSYLLVGNVFMVVGTIFGERLIYLPSAFFLILVALPLGRLRAPLLVPILAVITVLAAARSFTYAREWNDEIAFYDRTSREQPGSVLLYTVRYNAYKDRSDWLNARGVAEQAFSFLPDIAETFTMRIESDIALKDWTSARQAIAQGRKAFPPPLYPWEIWEQQIPTGESPATRP